MADIATAFTDAYAGRYAAADIQGLGALYGDESIVSFDGGSVKGRAALIAAMTPRVAPGPLRTRWASRDALTVGGFMAVFATGESERPAGRFTQVFTLFPAPGGGMYVRNDCCRFGAGSLQFSTALDPSGVGAAFAQQYYQVYGTSRASLAGVYRDTSQLTVEGTTVVGAAAIMEKVMSLPSGRHSLDTLDVQPVSPDALLVLVTGRIVLEGQENALGFGQAFVLATPPGGATPSVAAEFFRLNYGE